MGHHHHHHSGEVKPEVKPETHINLKVSDGSSEIFFKIKKTTPLRRLMEAFAKRQGKEMDSLRFLYDGIRIQADQTPEDLDMEDNDIIEAHREQIGGLTLAVLLQIAEHWATRDLRQIEDSKLRALLTLCAVLTRKFSKSQLGLLCETHLRHEGLGQDQADSVLEVYQRLHSDKGGNFEAALWQQWDRQSLIMFISAFLNIALQIPCESSSVVVSGLATLYPAQDNST
uniref:Minor nucleoprotein VP30 n=1 Tax=Reston ebolavirus (strain Reston-89) TaxID=386032 RepID=UPI00024DB0CB|nr:Chain A, Minor nucleoprotein VP30 [Reston ebolavirus - Reston (1989)]3V7O_B Chain B, Minor nucleoprotein VP30 [Reston ebolavirus - Reston (1989)]